MFRERARLSVSFAALALFLVFCTAITLGATKQEFDITPSNTIVNPQTTAKLTCKVRNRKGDCYWLSSTSQNEGLAIVIPIPGLYDFPKSPPNGDCSIQIINASLDNDDGSWVCQVPRTSREETSLQSEPVKLTVRNKPLNPVIIHRLNNDRVTYNNGDNFVTESDKENTLSCISAQGNPPSVILWYIDKVDISMHSTQINESDTDRAKTWRAKSTLRYVFDRSHHGKGLKCIAKHDSYPTGSLEVTVNLNVSYKPSVQLEGIPTSDVEEDQSLILKCVATANPPATVFWKKNGAPNYGSGETVVFNPLKRTDSGLYSCNARNSVGESEEKPILLDVKFKPKISSVEPVTSQALLFTAVKLHCEAEGNPKPKFTWLQSVSGEPNTWQHRGSNSTLYIQNATFSYQGKYICEVSNVIHEREHKDQSREINLDIVGPPQAEKPFQKEGEKLVVEKDDNAVIVIGYCSDPKPTEIYWEWGSVKLNVGEKLARYVSEQPSRREFHDDCYEARLVINSVESSDSRKYYLQVQNEKGKGTFDVLLQVKEPVTVSAVVGIVVGCVVVIVIVAIIVLYILRKDKCFWFKKKGFHPESENSSQRLSEDLHNGGHSPKTRAIPPDALYTDTQPVQHYENIKSPHIKPPHSSKEGIVYADLDLPALRAERHVKPAKERIEYAEIQFAPGTAGADM